MGGGVEVNRVDREEEKETGTLSSWFLSCLGNPFVTVIDLLPPVDSDCTNGNELKECFLALGGDNGKTPHLSSFLSKKFDLCLAAAHSLTSRIR
mmetsp:Transcript_40214/g.59115  ORF Transcript_40214/g.59115 Transcript_40214/m.59115 type:complete len:94 (+) Transcript_40214:79-360(+)